jgi:hypothetical protein
METGHRIAASTETYFRHTYDLDHDEMRRLYEQAKRDQWNASRDIDWATPAPDDGRLIADDLVDIYGTRYWDALSERDRVELNRRTAAWRLTLLMTGEHGAETSKDPLLRDICRRILQDEARHMGFGMLSLPTVVAEASERERNELEDMTVWALVRTLTGTFRRELHTSLIRNLVKIGLLTPRVAPQLASLGIDVTVPAA